MSIFTPQHRTTAYANPKTVSYETPGFELAQQDNEAAYLLDNVREVNDPDFHRDPGYERGARIALQALQLESSWSFARLMRRAIIAFIACLWSIAASVGRLTDEAIKKKELLIFSE